MIGVHVLIGIGEALITALVVSSVLAVRPDLVYGARGLVEASRAAAIRPSADLDVVAAFGGVSGRTTSRSARVGGETA
jgi:hypothetical protein